MATPPAGPLRCGRPAEARLRLVRAATVSAPVHGQGGLSLALCDGRSPAGLRVLASEVRGQRVRTRLGLQALFSPLCPGTALPRLLLPHLRVAPLPHSVPSAPPRPLPVGTRCIPPHSRLCLCAGAASARSARLLFHGCRVEGCSEGTESPPPHGAPGARCARPPPAAAQLCGRSRAPCASAAGPPKLRRREHLRGEASAVVSATHSLRAGNCSRRP